jgi:hypothetical protein
MERGQFENESLEIKNILNKFNHIGFLDYKEVKRKLLIIGTITTKLDYLKNIKENYFDKYLTVFLSLNEKEQRFQSEILESIFGNYELWSSLQIQEPIYDEFFRDLENQDTEYQYWFMRFSAEEKFKAKLNSEDYKDMIASNRSEKYFTAELKEINDSIEEVDTLKHRTVRDNKKGDDFIFDLEKSAEDQVSKWCFTDKETELIQIARILDLSYYKENIAKSNIDNLQAEIYFKYILYKEHLERLLKSKTINQKKLQQFDKNTQKPALTMNQIALKYVYKGWQITRDSGNQIAKEHNHSSGEKLFQKFTHYSSTANRKGKPHPFTMRKLENKIKLFESVVLLLSKENQSKAKDEVSTLKTLLESDY